MTSIMALLLGMVLVIGGSLGLRAQFTTDQAVMIVAFVGGVGFVFFAFRNTDE